MVSPSGRTSVIMPNRLTQAEARSAILKLLSLPELERVNDPDAVHKLAAGEEYLDLEIPLAGAQRSEEGRPPTGRVLTRSTVDGRTWQTVLRLVSPGATR
jgi:hypothetical protein